jgi:FixJ family two-component response regulator
VIGRENSTAPRFSESPIVYIIDSDSSDRQALRKLLLSVGKRVRCFTSASEFLQSRRPAVPSCLILEVRLPGISGPELHRKMVEANIHLPVIFVTAHGDISMSVRAIRAGAIDFLTKPVREHHLLEAVHTALEHDRAWRRERAALAALRRRLDSLTEIEGEIVLMVVSGARNKQIAARLGITENTVKVHRRRLVEKMGARSLPELVRMIEQLNSFTLSDVALSRHA